MEFYKEIKLFLCTRADEHIQKLTTKCEVAVSTLKNWSEQVSCPGPNVQKFVLNQIDSLPISEEEMAKYAENIVNGLDYKTTIQYAVDSIVSSCREMTPEDLKEDMAAFFGLLEDEDKEQDES